MILHLLASLLQFRSQAQILGLAAAAAGRVPQILGPVSGMSRLGAGTALLAALAEVHRDRARAKISEGLHLLIEAASSLLQLFEGVRHGTSII